MYKLNKTGVKMTNFVKIKQGTYRKNTVDNMVFPIVKPLNIGKKGAFITVDGTEVWRPVPAKLVLIEDPTQDLEYVTPLYMPINQKTTISLQSRRKSPMSH